MPSRNTHRIDVDQTYYHVYGRGASKMNIFLDDDDYAVWLNLLKRYIGEKTDRDQFGRLHKNYHDDVKLSAFCLMPNHFHLLFYQINRGAIAKVMQSVIVSYTKYFNRKYQRTGPLLESRYKASIILDDNYLMHVSRYIHLNPDNYMAWSWSSLPYYLGQRAADWLAPDAVLDIASQHMSSYQNFIDEYKYNRDKIQEMKYQYLDDFEE